MRVSLLEKTEHGEWDRYVLSSPSSVSYHLSGWKEVIEKSFGHRTFYLIAKDAKGIRGVLPLVQLKSMLFGNFVVSLPYFNYGGVCADTDEAFGELLTEACRISKDIGASHIEFKHVGEAECGLQVKKTKVTMELRLPPDADKLWNSFPSKLRSQIKRPMKEEMRFTIGRHEELESFYRVFSINMRDLGTPVYSKSFFKNILDTFPGSTWIGTVYTKEGEAVASGFLSGFKGTLEIPWASSLRSHNRLSPNLLLYWEILRFACEKGFSVFDFGRCTPGEGTYKFKEQWGAKPVQLHWYYWLRDGGQMPELNPHNPKYEAAIKIWKKLPVNLTRLIGPTIVKNLP